MTQRSTRRRSSTPAPSSPPTSTSAPYTIVGPDVRDRRRHARSDRTSSSTGRTTIGARNRIFQFASIGDIPQDRKYGGEPTTTTIGDDNVVREFVTIHAGTAQDRGATTIGDGNWFLAYTHVAHDCVVGNHTTFSNNAQIAGHVTVGDWVVLGGLRGRPPVLPHRRARDARRRRHGAAGRAAVRDGGGLPREARTARTAKGCAGAASRASDIAAVRRAYKTLYRDGLSLEEAQARALAAAARDAPVLAPLVEFLADSGRGIVR